MTSSISPLRLISGAVLILAGLFAYYGVRTVLALPIILIVAGGSLVLLVLTGRKPSGGDTALFVIALIVFGLAASGPGLMGPRETVTYSASARQIEVDRINLNVDADFGSVDVSFSNDESLGYRIDFSRPVMFPFQRDESGFRFSNETKDGALFLVASSTAAEIRVILGPGYITNIDVSADLGSINLEAPRTSTIETIRLTTGTGSIDGEITAEGVREISLRTGTGSIDLKSSHLAPATTAAPFTVSTGTGSVDIDITIPRKAAATLTATAGLGSLQHNLRGFTITHSTNNEVEATAGDPGEAETSFRIRVTTGTGSIDIRAERPA